MEKRRYSQILFSFFSILALNLGLASLSHADRVTLRATNAPSSSTSTHRLKSINGRWAASIVPHSQDVRVWVDDGNGGGTAGDGVVNGAEIRSTDISDSFYLDLTSFNNRYAVVNLSSGTLGLWVDDGNGGGTINDGSLNGSEHRLIDDLAVGTTGQTYRNVNAKYINSNVAVSFQRFGAGETSFKIWIDDGFNGGTSGDGTSNNGVEVRDLFTSSFTTLLPEYRSDFIWYNNHLALAFSSTTITDANASLEDNINNVFLWVDDGNGGGTADDGVFNGSEVRTVDGSTSGFNVSITTINSNMAISYFAVSGADNYKIRTWIDDGNGSGTSGDLVVNGSEIRDLDDTAVIDDFQSFSGIISSNSVASIAYVIDTGTRSSGGTLRYWVDDGHGGGTSGDGLANGSEIRTLDQPDINFSPKIWKLNDTIGITYVDFGSQVVQFFTNTNTPTLTSISPSTGSTLGGTSITLTGSNFSTLSTVLFGTRSATNVTFVNDTTLTSLTPSASSGTVSVTVTNGDGQTAVFVGSFTYIQAPAPTVTSVSPSSGFTPGGTAVTVSGQDFADGATIFFGSNPATNVTFSDSTTLTADTPSGPTGAVDVTVTNIDDQSGTLTNGFTYLPTPPPEITSVLPGSGALFGGTAITINGLFFQTGATVNIGGQSLLNVTFLNSISLRGTTPSGSAGSVDVVVTNPDGKSVTLSNGFTYATGGGITDVTQSKVFPTPFRPKDGHNTMIINAPDGSTVQIFTLSGDLVRELKVSGGGALWNVKNDAGQNIASGIYFFLVTDSQGNSHKGRIAVIR